MIFIVDNDAAIRESLRLLLEAEGFTAEDFATGRRFLETARPVYGDCLILDINMPGMNGYEVLVELCRRGDALPVIIVTAQTNDATSSRAIAAGAAAVLEKPYDTDELLALVRRVLTPATSWPLPAS
jgi:two-component system response regulator FixJ